MKTAFLINLTANGNRAEKRWNMVKEEILCGFPADSVVIGYSPPFDIERCIRDLVSDQGVNCLVSAGGDGSVNWILNAVMHLKTAGSAEICLGAIGLGSSNDYLKPISTRVKGFPVKINFNNLLPADVGKVTFVNMQGETLTRYFIVNASIGVTAEANLLFNTGDYFLDRIKPLSVKPAILYAALKTIIRFRNINVTMEYDRVVQKLNMTNISVVKNPNISGSFCYDQDIRPDDGWLGLNYCHDMNRRELVGTLMDLQKGKFSGKKNRVSALVKQCKFDAEEFLALETDGEVMPAKNIEFSILPGAITLAGN